jgi:hypothetical protein
LGSVWETLGIEPTAERAVIRRAYAARLKETNPEDDPEGFQQLRAAYERALAWAGPELPLERRARTPRKERTEPSKPRSEPPDDQATRKPAGRGEWRPAQEGQATNRSPRPHAWRAPEPKAPARRARSAAFRPAELPANDQAESQAYEAARRTLARLANDPAAESAALRAAFEAVLASPMLHSVARHDEAEAWIAQLIAINTPRTDPIVERAIAFFRWDEERVGPGSKLGARVVARLDDLKFLAATAAARNPASAALAALIKPPNGARLIANRLTPDLARRVRALLGVIRAERSGLIAGLDPAAVAWWDRQLSRPRLGPLAIWSLLVGPALLALLAWKGDSDIGRDVNDPLALFAGAFAIIGAVVLIYLYGVEWPRTLWRERWAPTAPLWARLGWAPALLTAVLLAAVAPASLWTTWAFAIGAGGLALWALAVGEPDRRDLGVPWPATASRRPVYILLRAALAPGVRVSWQARALFSLAYLGAFWLWAGREVGPAYAQMTAALVAAGVGFSAEAGSLIAVWRRVQAAGRDWIGLVALALCVAAALTALVAAREVQSLRPLAAALVATAVFAHKPAAAALEPQPEVVRDLLMRYGWFWLGLLMLLGGPHSDVVPVTLAVIGLPLLFATAVIVGRGAPGRRIEGVHRVGAAALRYGWLIALPALLSLRSPAGGVRFYVGGLWLLTGVAATVAGLVRFPERARRLERA